MFEALKSLLTRAAPAADSAVAQQPLAVAACALLLELAYADSEFTDDERKLIESVAMRHFDIDEARARQLLEIADEARRESVDLHQFTNVVVQHYDEGQRMVLAELMWRVIAADGRLDEQEDQLARRLTHLLDLKPGYLADARRRAQGG